MIVYLLRHYPQLSQTFVRNEIAGLRDLGHDVRVLSVKASDTEHVDPGWAGPCDRWPAVGVAEGLRALAWWARHHPVRTLRVLTAARAMGFSDHRRLALLEVPVVARRFAADRDVAAVHTHFAWPVSLEPTVLLGRLLGAPSSVTSHARDIYLPAPGLPRLLSLVDRMVTVCRYNVVELARTGLWSSSRPSPVVVPCGVDVPDVAGHPTRSGARVVSVGRLVEKKGFDDLIDAMAQVVLDVPDVRLDIFGDGPLREALQQQIDGLGLTSIVSLCGSAPHAQVLSAIGDADVFALACRVDRDGDSDAMPVVLREAMARGRSVVTTAVAGIPESIDARVGWLLPHSDAGAFAAALVEAVIDPAGAVDRGAAARRRVEQRWTTHSSAGSMSTFFSGEDVTRGEGAIPVPS